MQQQKSLLLPELPALDEHWFARLQPLIGVAGGDIYTVLMPDKAQLQALHAQFQQSGYRQAIDMRPHIADLNAYFDQNSDLAALKYEIAADEPNMYVKEAYVRRIDELILNNELLIAAVTHDDDVFVVTNKALYGGVSPTLYNAVCDWLGQNLNQYTQHDNKEAQRAAQHALSLLPSPVGERAAIMPSETVFQNTKAYLNQPGGYFDLLFAGTTIPKDTITQPVGDIITRQVLATIGCDYTVANASDRFWGVKNDKQQVVRPLNYILDSKEFRGIVAHEIGSHLLERVNGLRQPLRLLGIGLNGYEKGNEGRAFLREQVQYATAQEASQHLGWEYAITKHFAIALASGLDGAPRNFAEIYEIIYAMYYAWEMGRHPGDREVASHYAHNLTWALTTRVLKGTNGTGGAYLKDIVYLEGNAGYWQLASLDPAFITRGDCGKFNGMDAQHELWLSALGI